MARAHPGLVISRYVPAIKGLLPDAQQMAREAGLRGEELVRIATILRSLHSVFYKYDALVAEINPLVRTLEGMYLALDAKVEVDDSSLYRNPDFHLKLEEHITSPLERKGREIGVTNVELDGAITADLLYKVMDLVLQKERVKAVFINIYGGINPIHEGAKGVVRYMQEHDVTVPVVAKALGNRQEETWQIFEEGGVHVVTDASTEKGVEELARLLEGGT